MGTAERGPLSAGHHERWPALFGFGSIAMSAGVGLGVIGAILAGPLGALAGMLVGTAAVALMERRSPAHLPAEPTSRSTGTAHD